jgi:protein-S-isoprenylcysteine O-methyltransferase Ste14
MAAQILLHLSVFRLLLFFACFAYCVLAYRLSKPRGREIPAAIMASWTQFSIGVALDVVIVKLGFWTYRPMPFSLAGVPLDLHVNWALIWGFCLVWLYSRLRHLWKGWQGITAYLAIWVIFTVFCDALLGRHLPFLASSSTWWWLVDAVLLCVLLSVTLWVYHSILYLSPSTKWQKWNCRIRSVLYVTSLIYVFYVYLPGIILSYTQNEAVRPLLGLRDWRVLGIMMTPPVLLGTWAILCFSDAGKGTPIPLDPPLHLVTSGPYAFVRNPMQIAGMLLAMLLLLYYPTMFIAVYVLDMALTATVLMNLFERAQLENNFGDVYQAYTREVHNWMPRLTAWQPSPSAEALAGNSNVTGT